MPNENLEQSINKNANNDNISPEFSNQAKRLREFQQDSPVSNRKSVRYSQTPRNSHFDSNNRISILQLLDKRLDEHIQQIKVLWEERENKLLNIIDNLQKEVAGVNQRIETIESSAIEIIDMKAQIDELKLQAMKQENLFVACDLRINAVPFTPNEDVYGIFNSICQAVNIQTPSVKCIYRLGNKNNKEKENSPDAAIIVNLFSPYDKNFVLKSIATFKKQTECKQLKLDLIGFDSSTYFFVNESLTVKNYRILLEASKLKKGKHLHSAYSFRGLVYVKRTMSDQAIRIDNINQLNDIFPGSNGNHEPPNHTSNVNNSIN